MDSADATAVFIVRMWRQGGADSDAAWRGSVEDVRGKRRIYFTNLGSMCEFMVEQRGHATREE
jgi:hypothetical protein